jgi:hypothetical protein
VKDFISKLLCLNTLLCLPTEALAQKQQLPAANIQSIDSRLVSLTSDLARYTEWLFIATLALAFITLGLVVVGFLQIRDARKSVAAAVKSAAAAERSAAAATAQVALSRHAMVTTERAFVFCERIQPHWHEKKETEEIIEWIFTPIWRNSGKTPTTRATSNINNWIGIAVGERPENFDFPDYGDPGRTMIGPNATMHGASLRIPIDTLQKMRADEAHAYIWGWIDYGDIFDETSRHRAEFSMKIQVTGNPNHREGGFVFKLEGPFNGFDNDCYRNAGQYT